MASDDKIPQPAVSIKAVQVDLFNPTRALRILHDGLPGQKKVFIEPGQTLRNVSLGEHIVKDLKQRTKGRGNLNSDLHIFPAGQAPDATKADVDADDAA